MNSISVILPTYNSEKTICNAIDSVLCQTYKEFELIIIDDGSTDKTEEIIKQKYNDTRIIYRKNLNQGVSKSRNEAIKISKGDKICFIDSDDTYQKNFLEEMLKEKESDLVVCGYFSVTENRKKKISTNNFKTQRTSETLETLQPKILFNQVWNKMFDANIIKNNNISFDENINYGEDYLFVIKYLKKCKQITFVDKTLYNYFISKDGLGFSYHTDAGIIKIKAIDMLYDIYIENDYDFQYLYCLYIAQLFAYIINLNYSNNRTKNKIINIEKFTQSEVYNNTIKKIKKIKKINFKLMYWVLKNKNALLLFVLSFFANYFDKAKKQIRLK